MRRLVPVLLVTLLLLGGVQAVPAAASGADAPEKEAVATGTGGAAATVDALATQAAIDVLELGGNAFDAAIAAAAVLGVVEPYSSGIGGGGFLVAYVADEDRVISIDSREEAPAAVTEDLFVEDGEVIPFLERVTSGLGVGVPGTLAGWTKTLEEYGTLPLSRVLVPGIRVALDGFEVDQTFADQTAANLEDFRTFTSTAEVFLDDGDVPEVGSTFRNPDLARTYLTLAFEGEDAFYEGEIAEDIVEAVTDPPLADDATATVRPGLMTLDDLADYEAIEREPTRSDYDGVEIFGMGPPSSGGSTVGEILNILEGYDLDELDEADVLHRYLEASKFAFADRNAYLGDPAYVDVPLEGLLSDEFAAERRELIDPDEAAEAPVPAGDPAPFGDSDEQAAAVAAAAGGSTTHLTVADDHGNVVAYTFTIEQTGGSGIVVDDRGFLLNNELTDFNPVPNETGPSPNLPAGGKRPRSSIAPTVVLEDGEPLLAVGTPGGATIITTVAQILLNRLELGLDLPAAIAAPRASQRNSPTTDVEAPLLDSDVAEQLRELGHEFAEPAEIGAATGIEILADGRFLAAAEPERRGGGSAMVVDQQD